MGLIRRSEPMTDDEFNEWADAMRLATPNRIAVRRALTREYERGAATTRGAVGALEWIASAVPDEAEGVRPLDDLLDRIQGEALAALDRLKRY